MRIPCPICGERDRREFYYQGDALALNRPDPDAGDVVWNDYIHNRDNPRASHAICGITKQVVQIGWS